MQDIQDRVNFVELDATSPDWPVADSVSGIGVSRVQWCSETCRAMPQVSDSNYDIVLMATIQISSCQTNAVNPTAKSYISGSVPESVILPLYKNAFKAD